MPNAYLYNPETEPSSLDWAARALRWATMAPRWRALLAVSNGGSM